MNGLKPVSVLGARREHGDRLRYMAGCRCMLCRAANSRYETHRAAMRKNGDWNGIVSAAPARRHIRNLSRKGVGYKTVADAAGVARSIVMKIRSGDRRNIRARAERSILAVTAKAIGGDASLVDARETWKRLNSLLRMGFTKKALARLLNGPRSRALQIQRKKVTAGTAMRVEKLYRSLTIEDASAAINPRDLVTGTAIHCSDCAGKRIAAQERRQRKSNLSSQLSALRERRRRAGLCVNCGEARGEEGTALQCADCAGKRIAA